METFLDYILVIGILIIPFILLRYYNKLIKSYDYKIIKVEQETYYTFYKIQAFDKKGNKKYIHAPSRLAIATSRIINREYLDESQAKLAFNRLNHILEFKSLDIKESIVEVN